METEKKTVRYILIVSILFFVLGFYIGNFFDYFKKQKLISMGEVIYDAHGKIYTDEVLNYDRKQFHLFVQDNYKYTKKTDCKFYSMVWQKYFDNHGWTTNFITTNNHIQTIAWKGNEICIADLNMLNCNYYTFN